MKRILLFFCASTFFLFTWFNRYQPVSLDRISPTTKQVEIKGQVQNPGLYTVKWEATIADVITLSGGLLEDADTSQISMQDTIEDQAILVIPKKNDEIQLISINSASLEQLQTLPGIGPSLAQRIIDYRDISSFHTLEDIKNVKGIGDSLYNKIKDLICL